MPPSVPSRQTMPGLMFGEKPPVNTDVCRSRFMQSVRDGDIVELKKRIDIGIDVNFVDRPSLRTPLLEAVARGSILGLGRS